MATRYPVSPVFGMRDAVDRLFNEAFTPTRFQTVWSTDAGAPDRSRLPLDVYSTDDDVVVLAAVPGLSPDDIEITAEKNTVTISGRIPNAAESEHAKDASWHLHELQRGSFRRSLTLPGDIDTSRAEASFEHGMLRLTLPKAEAAKPRQIRVQVLTSGEHSEPAISEEAASEDAVEANS